MSTPLDPLALPLEGVQLIEASAGTGKTYTIASLYLRALLDAGRDISEILVVTFTEAATAELRGRIAERLASAVRQLRGAFEDDGTGGAGDEVVERLAAGLGDREAGARLLEDALTRFDEAAIFTIHGLCARVLAEHAFECGTLFDAEMLTDPSAVRDEVLADFWRLWCSRDADAAAWLCSRYPEGPAALARVAAAWDGRPDARLIPPPAPAAQHDRLKAEFAAQAAALAADWPGARAPLFELLAGWKGLSRDGKKGYREDRLRQMFAAMDVFCAAPHLPLPKLVAALGSEQFHAKLTKQAAGAPAHPVLDTVDRIQATAAELEAAFSHTLVHELRDWAQTEQRRRTGLRQQRTFDDLMAQVAAAVARGGPLAQTLAQRFPLAMIDEFQDTDPLQFGIFSGIYGARGDTGLLLIGDPKQAIYQFRGADVYTYVSVRRSLAPRAAQHTLDTNQRSASRLVAAVNTLFAASPAPFVLADIPFEPVRPAGRADRAPLVVQGDDDAPLRVWLLPEREDDRQTLSKGDAARYSADACADEIARLLQHAATGAARIGDQRLHARDIGVLVNDRHQAAGMQAALAARGVASVFLSRDPVYDSAEAQALEWVLAAVAEPASEARLRVALTGDLIGFDAAGLERLAADAPAWEACAARFEGYRRLWQRDGFMAMLLRLLAGEGIIARARGVADGARRLTNLLHLGELLQAQSQTEPGIEALLHRFAELRRNPARRGEAAELRLESDENLVQIVTVHRSKGLEYPLVFVPFAWAGKQPDQAPPAAWHEPPSLQYTIDYGSAELDAHLMAAEDERMAEQVRLLYVALTRARHRCYLLWGQVRYAEYTGLARLLHPHPGQAARSCLGATTAAQRAARWQALEQAGGGALRVEPLPASRATLAEAGGLGRGAAKPFAGPIAGSWRLTSYSGLLGSQASPQSEHAAAAEGPEHDAVDAGPRPRAPAPEDGIAGFPRGAAAGTFLHGVLETLDFPRASGAALREHLGPALRRAGYAAHWLPVLEDMFTRVLDTPLDGAGLRLRDIPRQRRRDELEFHFPIGALSPERLDGPLRAAGGLHLVPELRFAPVEGVMRGFIDLVFEYQGRYYLADWKSNWLGPDATHYDSTRIQRAMAEHRYDLQYLVYAVALHRYLAQRLPQYDYERHFGGVYYLFLRGMAPHTGAGRGVYFARPDAGALAAFEACLCGPAPAES